MLGRSSRKRHVYKSSVVFSRCQVLLHLQMREPQCQNPNKFDLVFNLNLNLNLAPIDRHLQMANEKTKIYHERQKLQFCLVHSLNNLFQAKDAFTRPSLNAISEKLVLDDPNKEKWTPLSAFLRPHHNAITGNYDINVLIYALEEKGKRVVWHDRRNGASAIVLDNDTLMGIVLNIPVRQFGGLWRSRHWVTMKRIEGVWYNLDSDLRAPQSFKDYEQVREFLDYIIGLGGEVLLVMNDKESPCSYLPHKLVAANPLDSN